MLTPPPPHVVLMQIKRTVNVSNVNTKSANDG